MKKLAKNEAKKRINQLKQLINHHRYLYHVKDTQEISDAALDGLKHELYQLEEQFPEFVTADSPTQRVGGKALEKFTKVTHAHRMFSMEDIFSREEFEKWVEKVERVGGKVKEFYCMQKVDGLAISLIYKNGVLQTAATRGDGKVGEDVTQNVKTIESIPLILRGSETAGFPETVEVRGEIYMAKKDFERLNKEMEQAGEKTFANPRNVSAGSIRQLDPTIAASRPLRFSAWHLSGFDGKTQDEDMKHLEELGFRVVDGAVKASEKEIEAYIQEVAKKREKLGHWIDGIVVRVNRHDQYRDLGIVGKTPRGLVAWKFPAEEAVTKVLDVDWSVGRTGKLTPIARLEPTFVAGTTVQNASLHNIDEIRRLGLKKGDTVILTKAGDIIPKITKVFSELRTGEEVAIREPKECPVCASPVTKKEGQVDLLCTNPSCYSKERERILYAARAFGIDGLGGKRIEHFMDAGFLQLPSDIFFLNVGDIESLDGYREKSATQIVEEIQAKKTIELNDFIAGLGIPQVGGETAYLLASQYGSLKNLQNATKEELVAIKDIGETVAEAVQVFFASEYAKHLLAGYEEAGVKILEQEAAGDVLKGMTIVMTGTLAQYSRDEMKDLIRRNGGAVSSSVSKKTSYVLLGENPGSKAQKAKDLGVPTLSEEEILSMLGEKK